MENPRKVVFVCVHNSGRSQMAEAFARKLGKGKIIAESAGTQPGESLNPQVVEAMREIGYDMSGHYPKMLTWEMAEAADRLITMGCGVNADSCPAVARPMEDWGIDDPAGQPLEKVREIRDQVKAKVGKLISELE